MPQTGASLLIEPHRNFKPLIFTKTKPVGEIKINNYKKRNLFKIFALNIVKSINKKTKSYEQNYKSY